MKKLTIILSIIAAFIIFPATTFAEGYFSMGGGGGSNGSNLTLELGKISTDREHNYLMALGLGFIFNAGNVPAGTLDYPCPHSYYTNLGTEQKGNEMAIVGKYGLEIIKNEGLFLVALAGFSLYEEVALAQSNATGWYYEQSSSTGTYGVFGGGLNYFPPGSKVSFQVEYDNRRGVTGGVGFRW